MADLDHGVIAQLINIPEDNAGKRFLASLLASLGINAVAMVGINIANLLHEDAEGPPATIVAKPVDLAFDEPALIKPETKPTPAPTPKPERAKPSPKPEVKKPEIKKPEVKKPEPTPVPDKQTPTAEKPTPEPQPSPEPTAETKPETKPAVKPTVRTTATERRQPTELQQANATSATSTSTTSQTTLNTSTSTQNTAVARSATSARDATQASEVSAALSASTATKSTQPTRALGGLATSTRVNVSASSERANADPILVGGGNNPAVAAAYRPSVIARSSGVSGSSGGAVRGGSSGYSASASGSVSAATISAPSYVGRRGPAIGNTSLAAESKAVLTSAMSDDGRANAGLASIQGAKGSVATSVALGGGRASVSGASSGRAGVGGGGGGGGCGHVLWRQCLCVGSGGRFWSRPCFRSRLSCPEPW